MLTLGVKPKKRSIKQQVGDQIGQAKRDASETLKDHHYWEIVEKWAIGQLPYHPEMIWRKARFNTDLSTAADVPTLPTQRCPPKTFMDTCRPVPWTHDSLSSLTSETARRAMSLRQSLPGRCSVRMV